ncbi:MAG: hypothetical protein LV473_14395 [Nitrospira sp.]|nr:hypothetical protein [Nitrospira sp.]
MRKISRLVVYERRPSQWRKTSSLWLLFLLLIICCHHSAAEEIGPANAPLPQASGGAKADRLPDDVEERIRRLESQVNQQAEQIRQLKEKNKESAAPVPDKTVESSDEPSTIRGANDIPSPFSDLLQGGNDANPRPDAKPSGRGFLAGFYDKGFVLVAPIDNQRMPFALKLNATLQLRYTGFVRTKDTFTDSSGQVLPILTQSDFSLNRGLFVFSGYALNPKLQYNLTVFGSTTTNTMIAIGSLTYQFSKGLALSIGYYNVPGTREWMVSSRYTLGADRTMANTFFRPSLSPGVWISGQPLQGLFYYAGIYNNFNASANNALRASTDMTYSANLWWEPLGAFGPGYSDEEYHESLVLRMGTSLTFQRVTREPDSQSGQTNPENTIFRLSDGTPLFQPGAIAPGVTLTSGNLTLFSYDLAFKYRGWSLSGEYYARWTGSPRFSGGPTPQTIPNLFVWGGLGQFSYAILPKRLELFARTSGVFGSFGDGNEYGGGMNWYVLATRNLRSTFEVKRINHSPANNLLYGYASGQSGTLFQFQMLMDF